MSELVPVEARLSGWRRTYKVHYAADFFPMMTREELRELGEDIKKNGLLSQITMMRNHRDGTVKVLDGRNRLDAMELVGLDTAEVLAAARVVESSNPVAYVVSANLHRRHLNREQRAELHRKCRGEAGMSTREIAKLTGSPQTTVQRDLAGESSGSPERITGADGKTYPARRPPTEREKIRAERRRLSEQPPEPDGTQWAAPRSQRRRSTYNQVSEAVHAVNQILITVVNGEKVDLDEWKRWKIPENLAILRERISQVEQRVGTGLHVPVRPS